MLFFRFLSPIPPQCPLETFTFKAAALQKTTILSITCCRPPGPAARRPASRRPRRMCGPLSLVEEDRRGRRNLYAHISPLEREREREKRGEAHLKKAPGSKAETLPLDGSWQSREIKAKRRATNVCFCHWRFVSAFDQRPPSSPRLTLPLICSNGLPFMRQGMGELDVKDVTELNGADGRQRLRVHSCGPQLQSQRRVVHLMPRPSVTSSFLHPK